MTIKIVGIFVIGLVYDCCRMLEGVGVFVFCFGIGFGVFFLNFVFLLLYLAFLLSLNSHWSYLVTGDITLLLCFVSAQYELSRCRCCFMVLPTGDAPLKGEEIAFG